MIKILLKYSDFSEMISISVRIYFTEYPPSNENRAVNKGGAIRGFDTKYFPKISRLRCDVILKAKSLIFTQLESKCSSAALKINKNNISRRRLDGNFGGI